MQSPLIRIRTEVINRIQNSIRNKKTRGNISNEVLQDLTTRLVLVNDKKERKTIINQWYKDLLSADTIRKHHLQYQNPNLTRELSVALNSLTVNFEKRFHNYIS